ncbi:MAG: hypothetical protein SH857_08300 [Chitinophagales bacterium]|nr:hypothetical protein [Chitinophagales bacterium]
MVKVTVNDDHVIFDVVGMHKFWSFKDQIKVPREHIAKAHNNLKALPVLWRGWRLPGTHVPFVITAGTYYQRGNKNFWDVVKQRNAIIVELKDEKYKNLIIEVEKPEETLALLNAEPTK